MVRSTRTTGLAKDADPMLHSQTTLLPASSSSKSIVDPHSREALKMPEPRNEFVPDRHWVEYNPSASTGKPTGEQPNPTTTTASERISGEQRPLATATTSSSQDPLSNQSFVQPTVSTLAVSPHSAQKPHTPIYGNLQNIGSSKKSQDTTSGRAETHPTATTPIAPSSIHPHATMRPSQPTISAPQPQNHASTSTSKDEDKEIEEHTPKATLDTMPTRLDRVRGELSQLATQYANMLFALDDIPVLYNILASFFNWILLAGFILFPGTLTSTQVRNRTGQESILQAVTDLPL